MDTTSLQHDAFGFSPEELQLQHAQRVAEALRASAEIDWDDAEREVEHIDRRSCSERYADEVSITRYGAL